MAVKKLPKPNRRFAKLRALGDEKLAMIRGMLLDGKKPAWVAHQIQHVWGDLEDMSPAALIKQLGRFKNESVDIPAAAQAGKLDKEKVARLLKIVDDKLDLHGYIKTAVELQRERLESFLNQKGLPTTIFGKELERFFEFTEKAIRIEQSMGVIPVAPKELKGHISVAAQEDEQRYNESLARSRKVRAMVSGMLADAEKNLEKELNEFEALDTGVEGAGESGG